MAGMPDAAAGATAAGADAGQHYCYPKACTCAANLPGQQACSAQNGTPVYGPCVCLDAGSPPPDAGSGEAGVDGGDAGPVDGGPAALWQPCVQDNFVYNCGDMHCNTACQNGFCVHAGCDANLECYGPSWDLLCVPSPLCETASGSKIVPDPQGVQNCMTLGGKCGSLGGLLAACLPQ